MLREATASDSPRIAEIYNYYVLNTSVTLRQPSLFSFRK